MRNVLALILLLGFAAPAFAQANAQPVCRDVYLGPVIVKTLDHRTLHGTLQCLTESEVLLLTGTGLQPEPLMNVTKVATPRDSIWDGVLKGVIVGILSGTLGSEACHSSSIPECVVEATLEMGVIGGVIDAMNGHNYTIYPRKGPAPALEWLFHF